MSIKNQAFEIDIDMMTIITLSNGETHTFNERPVRLFCTDSVDGLYAHGKPFVPSGEGPWHILVLGIDDYGQVPLVIAQLTAAEAEDMDLKMRKAYDVYLAE